MPDSLKQAVDAFDFTYGMPVGLEYPPAGAMRSGLTMLELGLRPSTKAHAAQCIAKLAVAANFQQSKDEARMRLEVWWEANGDLPADLWEDATRTLLQTFKFGMPKPADLRGLVQDELQARKYQRSKLREMIERAGREKQPYVREPYEVRIRGLRDSWHKVGKIRKAAQYERHLAELEQREPEAWALDVHSEPEVAQREERPPFTPTSDPRLKAMAEEFRRKQREAIEALNKADQT